LFIIRPLRPIVISLLVFVNIIASNPAGAYILNNEVISAGVTVLVVISNLVTDHIKVPAGLLPEE
jgi:hypothetical protein